MTKAKRIISLLLSFLLVACLAFAFVSCNEEPECAHADANYDGACDKCGNAYGTACTHSDENKDKKCDSCGTDYTAPCTDHISADEDAACDYCGAAINCTACVDTDANGKCDVCGKTVEVSTASGEVELVKDGKVKFQFVIASAYKQNTDVIQKVDKLINKIKEKKATAERVSDTANTEKAIEILIGSPENRGDIYKVDGHHLGYNGYSISVVGTKALVLGGSASAVVDAIDALESEILKISNKNKTLVDCVLTEKNSITEMPDVYTIEQILIAGNNIKDYVIAVDKALMYSDTSFQRPYVVAQNIQENIYKNTGIWLTIVDIGSEYDKAIVLNVVAPEVASKPGFKLEIKGGNMNIECGFPNKLGDAAMGFFRSEITNKKQPIIRFNENYSTTINLRDIKYHETHGGKGGAIGDGVVDDFNAIKEIHDYANIWGHTVNARIGDTYYIGKGNGSKSIIIQTDTNWSGASFLFDDSKILPGDKELATPIFKVTRDESSFSLSGSKLPVQSLDKSATKIDNWNYEHNSLVILYNSNVRHFIRYGSNQDNGASQTELLIVKPDGTIDENTPLQWSYDVITSMEVYPIDDKPITIGATGNQMVIKNKSNLAPSAYTYYSRNISIERSNVVIQNIYHEIIDAADHGAPYGGFISVNKCNNVTVDGCTFTCPKGYSTIGSAGESVGMGSYEITATSSNNVTWSNCNQTNFFQPDGSVKFDGMMGTNYCKNLFFDSVFMCSFDAHKGTYNATLKNSTCEHINFIGEGTIKLENMTIYTDGSFTGINLRNDYGSTWQGELIIDGLDMRYTKTTALTLIKTTWFNHDFGYITYLPEYIELNNITLTKYSYTYDADGVRHETNLSVNDKELHIVQNLERYVNVDLSDPNADMTNYKNDLEKCVCDVYYSNHTFIDTDGDLKCDHKCGKSTTHSAVEDDHSLTDKDGDGSCDDECNVKAEQHSFYDSNGDGKCDNRPMSNRPTCWGYLEEPDTTINLNPYMPIKTIKITNSPGLKVVYPNTPQFKDMHVWVDGVEIAWKGEQN